MSEERWSAEPGWLEKIGWTLDACVTLNSFTGIAFHYRIHFSSLTRVSLIADPSQSARLSSHHGLLHILHMPRVNVLVPASERISTLRGMSVTTRTIRGNTLNMTGVGENNIAFKCTRRRLVFETFHLDVEGGVGERRTTPAPSTLSEGAARAVDASAQSAKQVQHTVEVHVEDVIPEEHTHQTVRSPTAKKVRKKVGFQVNKPDLYDF
jgi:elongator complex protein 4